MKNLFVTAILTFALSPVCLAAKETSTTYKVDTAASEVTWVGKKAVIKSEHTGTIKVKSGEVTFKKDQIEKATFEIDMASLENVDLKGNPKQADLVGHLKSPDFFDVAKFPTAKFVLKKAVKAKTATADYTHDVTGDLTLKGETHEITFPAKITTTDKDAQAVANLKIDRTVWNVRYASDKFFQGLGDKVIANDIDLKLNLKATK